MTPEFWQGKKVFLTGHTGFKGSWLCLLLHRLGAEVYGYALEAPTAPNLFTEAKVRDVVKAHTVADIRDAAALKKALGEAQPDIILHMAAQPLLLASYAQSVETYAVNVMGTVALLEAARDSGARVILNVTTDKCYENRETRRAYVESDPLGGFDPYSSSKACAELVTAAYARSFFADGAAIATARSGNVIGGGDWSAERLVPDIFKALAKGEKPVIRNPSSLRPWQHVLEPLAGYLSACEYLWDAKTRGPEAWNFGPDAADSDITTLALAQNICRRWGGGAEPQIAAQNPQAPHEATLLKLDSSKAHKELGWKPRWPLATAVEMTVDWFRAHKAGEDMRAVSLDQISAYRRMSA